MRSVSVRLVLSFLVVAVVGIGLVAFLANRTATVDFNTYLQYGRSANVERMAQTLSDYYAHSGNWSGVQALVDNLQPSSDGKIILMNSDGVTIAESAEQTDVQPTDEAENGVSAAITVNGIEIGKVRFLPGEGSMIAAAEQGKGRGLSGVSTGTQSEPTNGTPNYVSAEQSYLNTVNRSLWMATLGAISLAVVLGLFLTVQIVRPLRKLTLGAQRIAKGELGARMALNSSDELGQLGAAFDTMAEKLERDESLRRNLMADITHELRTPLSIIEGMADGILDNIFEPTTENITTIKEEAQLLSRLVSDLRELALAEAGELRLNLDVTEIGRLVGRAAHRWDKTAYERGVDLSVHVEDGLPSLSVDPERLTQVVGNLLNNAIRHTPIGGNVAVNVSECKEEVVITITDNGEGIAPNDIPFVFERFYRGDKSRARRRGGSGLGLAIVKQLTQAMGGRVWVESEVGKGSIFRVALPITTPLSSTSTDQISEGLLGLKPARCELVT